MATHPNVWRVAVREGHDDELEQRSEGPEPPPRGTRTMTVVRWAIVVLSVALAAAAWWSFARSEPVQAERYQCPMHPQVVSDRPGECPICHMDLEPVSESRSQTAATKPKPPPSAKASVSAPAPAPAEARSSTLSDAPADSFRRAGSLSDLQIAAREAESVGRGRRRLRRVDGEPSLPGDVAPIELALDRTQAIGVRTALAESAHHPEASCESAPSSRLRNDNGTSARAQRRVRGAHRRQDTGCASGADRSSWPCTAGALPGAERALARPELGCGWPRRGDARAGAGQAGAARHVARANCRGPRRTKRCGRSVSAAPVQRNRSRQDVVLGSYVTPDVLLYESSTCRVCISWPTSTSAISRSSPSAARVPFFAPGQSEPVARVQIDLVYPSVASDVRARRVRMRLANRSRRWRPAVGVRRVRRAGSALGRRVDSTRRADRQGLATYVFVSEGEGRYAPRAVVVAREQAHRSRSRAVSPAVSVWSPVRRS